MPYLAEREPERNSLSEMDPAQPELRSNTDDGTGQLLRTGGGTLLVGIVAALLTKTVFGGIGSEGPHTNLGWCALLVAMGCLPFGFLLTLLGAAKWLRNRKLKKN